MINCCPSAGVGKGQGMGWGVTAIGYGVASGGVKNFLKLDVMPVYPTKILKTTKNH